MFLFEHRLLDLLGFPLWRVEDETSVLGDHVSFRHIGKVWTVSDNAIKELQALSFHFSVRTPNVITGKYRAHSSKGDFTTTAMIVLSEPFQSHHAHGEVSAEGMSQMLVR